MDTTTFQPNVLDFTTRAVRAYLATQDPRYTPGDRRAARARFDGLADAADALGLAMTPAHFQITVAEAVAANQPRPAYSVTGSNDALRQWDVDVAADVLGRL